MDEARLSRIEEAISTIVEAVRAVCEKQSAMDEELDKLLSSDVYGRLESVEKEFGGFVGGMNDIIDGRKKREYAGGFREKHPEFGRFEPLGKSLGLDVYDIAVDSTFGKPDDEADSVVAQMLEELNAKFGKMVEALEKLEGHEAAEHGEENKPEGEKPEGGMEIELEFGDDKPSPSIVEEARRYRGTRAG